jgi:hypothetical protein
VAVQPRPAQGAFSPSSSGGAMTSRLPGLRRCWVALRECQFARHIVNCRPYASPSSLISLRPPPAQARGARSGAMARGTHHQTQLLGRVEPKISSASSRAFAVDAQRRRHRNEERKLWCRGVHGAAASSRLDAARASGARGLAESRAAARRGRPALIDRPSVHLFLLCGSLTAPARRLVPPHQRLTPRSGRKPLLAPGRRNARAKGPC